jgi:hypothetical protein
LVQPTERGMSLMQWLMIAAAIVLFVAAAMHFGAFGLAYAHARARVPETIIGLVLIAGALVAPAAGWGPPVALGALIFGMLGVLLGIYLVVVGVGPHTAIDYALHGLMLVLLIAGLVSAWAPGGGAATSVVFTTAVGI